MINKIFVSGMMRSGTTLLQEAINAHPNAILNYQTKTSEFIELKKKFLNNIDCNEYHALKHYNPSTTYKYTDFISWLNSAIENNSVDLVQYFYNEIDCSASLFGFKEVLMEEFYLPLINNGVKCLNIIRDPRDVISSMSFGRGEKHTGACRPVLFDLRNWRKSVHFSHSLQDNENFKFILFEELLRNPESVLNDVYEWLGLKKVSVEEIEKNIKTKGWGGNSSFGSRELFDPKAVGGYQSSLPGKLSSYIEAVCFPEMKNLGYETSTHDVVKFKELIRNYSDPFLIERDEFDQNYSSSISNVEYELSRLNKEYVTLVKETSDD